MTMRLASSRSEALEQLMSNHMAGEGAYLDMRRVAKVAKLVDRLALLRETEPRRRTNAGLRLFSTYAGERSSRPPQRQDARIEALKLLTAVGPCDHSASRSVEVARFSSLRRTVSSATLSKSFVVDVRQLTAAHYCRTRRPHVWDRFLVTPNPGALCSIG